MRPLSRRSAVAILLGLTASLGAANAMDQEELNCHPPYIHHVTEDIPTLGEISIYYFGTTKRGKDIIRWNHLKRDTIHVGQKLLIRECPKIKETEGNELLLDMWRRLLAIRENDSLEELKLTPAEVKKAKIENSPYTKLVKQYATELKQEMIKGASKDEVEEIEEELSVIDLRKQGREDFSENRYEDALEKFEESRKKDPTDLSSWFYSIRCLVALKRKQEARDLADEFLKARPDLKDHPFLNMVHEGKLP